MVLVRRGNIVLLDLLQVGVVLDLDVCGNSIKVTFLSQLIHPVPICLGVTFNRSYSKGPGAINSGVLLHAIIVSTVVDLDLLTMDPFVSLGDVSAPN